MVKKDRELTIVSKETTTSCKRSLKQGFAEHVDNWEYHHLIIPPPGPFLYISSLVAIIAIIVVLCT